KKFKKGLAWSVIDPYSSRLFRSEGQAKRRGRCLKNFFKMKGLQAKVKVYNAQLLRDEERIREAGSGDLVRRILKVLDALRSRQKSFKKRLLKRI
ncbi:hypothetical protein, partial [Marinimicrobium locisalis]|uniref:hypothetical protein n=1 Tax=Marinimicrobium locisalis TaxID=546022 RepID=UPI00322184B5